jgi:hypothetical protein
LRNILLSRQLEEEYGLVIFVNEKEC